MPAGAEDQLATFSFPGVSQTIVKNSAWGQCPNKQKYEQTGVSERGAHTDQTAF